MIWTIILRWGELVLHFWYKNTRGCVWMHMFNWNALSFISSSVDMICCCDNCLITNCLITNCVIKFEKLVDASTMMSHYLTSLCWVCLWMLPAWCRIGSLDCVKFLFSKSTGSKSCVHMRFVYTEIEILHSSSLLTATIDCNWVMCSHELCIQK
jgi:hypothetical protein